MAIRILAPHEAAKIAAGEVIERPASVVKELIENSLDAGARRIAVEIREGGLALIRVADDGCGIEPGEIRLAFERHATSKVASEADLWRVATLGFRGEALPSIAAAGDVEFLTRVAGNDVGARIRLRGGEILEEGSGATAPGTTFTVRRLFGLQPARLKFLRAPAGEATQVSSVVMHYAMAYPEVRFELTVDGRLSLQTPGSASLIDAIAAVYGAEVAAAAISIDAPPANEGDTGVRGVVVEPRLHRSSRNYISLYVNRRWVRNRALTFAVEEAYQGMLPVGRRPIAVLDLRVPADEVDVNVHPTKAEVRLRREREVFGVLQRAVRRALSSGGVIPAASTSLWLASSGDSDTGRPPLFLRPQPVQTPLPRPPVVPRNGDPAVAIATGTMVDRLPMLRPVGQVAGTYIVAEGPEGMYVIDQHAAHERVLYERFLASVRTSTPDIQPLLAPVTLELPPAQRASLDEHRDAFAGLGFDIEPFGDAAYLVRAIPSALAGDDVPRHLLDLLERMARDGNGDGDAAHRVAASLACHAAVRAGNNMSDVEQRELLRLLEGADAPRTCPHGRPTMVHLAADAIAREFRRT
ncbi:MAG TPA: DNA mismatch repair endonuclease MutL [Dehalococcoidia bacterium]|nr:DNA mismatch repair endonuclease MutL [Dehalococcoidia bacterium]